MVSKIMLYSTKNHAKTLPLVMYEDCNGIKSKVRASGLWYHLKYIPYSIYPRYFFDQESMKTYEMPLKTIVKFLDMPDTVFYNNFFKNKIVIIGNFSTDMHITPVGRMPGSIIIFNTFLTLEAGYHLYSWGWFLYLLIALSFLSYFEFYYKPSRKKINDKPSRGANKTWHSLIKILDLTGLCILLSLVSDVCFGIHSTILPVILYFQLVLYFKKIFIKNKLYENSLHGVVNDTI